MSVASEAPAWPAGTDLCARHCSQLAAAVRARGVYCWVFTGALCEE